MNSPRPVSPIEPILDPDLMICDAHHHLWDRPGNRYLLDDLLVDLGSGHRIASTVHVDCVSMYREQGPESLKPVGETEYMEAIAASAPERLQQRRVCAGIVGFADLNLGAAVSDVLDAHLAVTPRFKGVRHCAAWDASDRVVNAHTDPFPHMLEDTRFQQGFRELVKRGLSFDAWVFHPQISNVTRLARAFPDACIVLDHLGGPLGIGPYAGKQAEVFEHWKRSIEELARCPNVVVKLGGIQMPLNGWGFHRLEVPLSSSQLVAATRRYYLHALDCFGVERCLFESNYPADRPSASYAVIWNAFKLLTLGFSHSERAALFHDNAMRIYRLERPEN